MHGVEISPLEERHAEELFQLIDRNRQHLRQWLPWLDDTSTAADTVEFIRRSLEQCTRQEGIVQGIFREGRLAGLVSFVKIDWANRTAMIGYWLGEEFQGKGLMTFACQEMIDYAFEDMKLNRLEIKVAIGNVRSLAVARRLGFKPEGVERQAGWLYDHFVDIAVYSLLRCEWEGRRLASGNNGAVSPVPRQK